MRLQIVRLLDTLRQALSWITTIIHYLPFKNFLSFAVCSVLLFFHNLCPKYSWIPLDFCVCVCFQLFVYGFIFSLKKWAYLKHERVLLYSKTDRLAGFSNPSLSLVLNYICSKQIWCKSNYSSIVINRSIFAHMVNCKNGYYFILAGADGWLPGNIYCILIIV